MTLPEHAPRVAIFQFISHPVVGLCVEGVVDGLRSEGFVDDKTVRLRRYNSEGDFPTANSIARGIVDGDYDLVVTLTTPALQTMASANRDGHLIHVFGAVTDPFSAGVGIQAEDPLDHPPHLAGIGTFEPVREVLTLAKKIYPELRRVGTIWNASEAGSAACVKLAREVCAELGCEFCEVTVENSAGVLEAAKAVVGRDLDVILVSGDNTVLSAFECVVRTATEAGLPVITTDTASAAKGALLNLGADPARVGRFTGTLAARILRGLEPADVPIENVIPECLTLGLQHLDRFEPCWHVPAEVRARAVEIYDESGLIKAPGEEPPEG